MKFTYLVTEGEYSDYRVICAYERERDAKKAVTAGVGDDLTAVPLLAAGEIPVKVPVWHVNVRVLGGRVEIGAPWSMDYWPWEASRHGSRRISQYHWHFEGPDRERVMKAAQDKAAQLRAEREGVV